MFVPVSLGPISCKLSPAHRPVWSTCAIALPKPVRKKLRCTLAHATSHPHQLLPYPPTTVLTTLVHLHPAMPSHCIAELAYTVPQTSHCNRIYTFILTIHRSKTLENPTPSVHTSITPYTVQSHFFEPIWRPSLPYLASFRMCSLRRVILTN